MDFKVKSRHFGSCFQNSDFIEGTNAFLDKRKLKF